MAQARPSLVNTLQTMPTIQSPTISIGNRCASKKSIDEMRASREAESRPYLFSYLAFVPSETNSCYLLLRNYGKTGAVISSFSISPTVELVKGPNNCNFFARTVIAPEQSIQMLVIDQKYEVFKIPHKVNIEYHGIGGKSSYSDSYELYQRFAGEAGSLSVSRSGLSKTDNAIIDIAHSLNVIKASTL